MSDIFIVSTNIFQKIILTTPYSTNIVPSLYRHNYCVIDEYLLISTDCVPVSESGVIKSQPGFATGSGVDFNYLTFLDICSQATLFRHVNDGTRAVRLPSTLSIGKCTYQYLYVRLSHYFYGYNISLYFDLDKL